MDANIISMSWTYKTGGADPKQLKDFQTAVNEAVVKTWCASTLSMTNWRMRISDSPLSNDAIIRICSATKSSEKTDQGKFRAADYLFPGQDIPIAGDNKNQNSSGSSVATALAAGLAGVILYTQRLLLSDTRYNLTMPQRQKLEAWS